MDLIPYEDESRVVYFSSSKDCSEIVDLWVNRSGELFAKITCPKDQTTTITLGKIDLPPDIKKLGKKVFRAQSTQWLAKLIKGPSLKFGAGNTYFLSLKIGTRGFERRGKFRV
jgi:hypothetical protein